MEEVILRSKYRYMDLGEKKLTNFLCKTKRKNTRKVIKKLIYDGIKYIQKQMTHYFAKTTY